MKKKLFSIFIAFILVVASAPISTIFADNEFLSNNINSNKFDEFAEDLTDMINEYDSEEVCSSELIDNDDAEENTDFSTKRLIVKSQYKLDDFGATSKVEGFFNLHIFQYDTEEQAEKAYEKFLNLKNSGKVIYVEKDTECSTASVSGGLENTDTNSASSFNSWGAEIMGIDIYQAYLLNQISKDGTSKGLHDIVVGVVDTGIDDDHEIFKGYYDPETNPEGRILKGKNFSWTGNEDDTNDVVGHGTHVSGTITELTLSNVKILPVKVFGDSLKIFDGIDNDFINGLKENLNTSSLRIALGMMYAVRNADIINVSMGGLYSPLINDIVNTAFLNGVLVVSASGNLTFNAKFFSPSGAISGLTVSSVNENLEFSDFSNYGMIVDVAAPGENILSSMTGGDYISASGTSMAAPHVTGLAALFKSADYKLNAYGLSKKIKESAYDLGEEGEDNYYGSGLAYAKIDEFIGLEFYENAPGKYDEPITTHISSSNPDVKIFYTLDGTEPSEDSIEYNSGDEIKINETTVLRAVAYRDFNGKLYKENLSQIRGEFCIAETTPICYKLEIDSGGKITGYQGEIIRDLVIPNQVDGITVREIANKAFESLNNIERVILPDTLTKFNQTPFNNCENLKEMIISDESDYFCTIDGVLYSKDRKTLVMCPEGRLGEFVIPDGVETIQSFAFCGTGLMKLVIPDSVKTMQAGAIITSGKTLVVYGSSGETANQYVDLYNSILIFLDINFKDTIIDKIVLFYVNIIRYFLLLPI